MLSVIMLSVIMLSVIMLSVIMLSVIMLSVIYAECQYEYCSTFTVALSERCMIDNLSFMLKVGFLLLYWVILCWMSVRILQSFHSDFLYWSTICHYSFYSYAECHYAEYQCEYFRALKLDFIVVLSNIMLNVSMIHSTFTRASYKWCMMSRLSFRLTIRFLLLL